MTMKSEILSLLKLSQITYDPETGVFVRATKLTANACDRADRPSHRGYRTLRLSGHRFYAHRIAWFMSYGKFPDREIDHINGDPSDNRLANLREATRTQNCGNVVKATGMTGLYGVGKQSNTSRYRSSITVNSKRRHLGYFDTAEEAHAAAIAEVTRVRGEFSPVPRMLGASA